VVLFLVSVIVSSIAQAISRETIEARAAAAFNGVEERLHAFEITGTDGSAFFSHIPPSRDVTFEVSTGFFAPRAMVTTRFRSREEELLFDQKLRAFLNIPAEVNIVSIWSNDVSIRPSEVRRKHPERVLRTGDRMGTAIDMRDIPNPNASVLSAGSVFSGTGQVSASAAARRVNGTGDSLFEAPLLSSLRVISGAFESPGTLRGGNATVNGTIVSGSVQTGMIQVGGLLRSRSSTTPDVRVLGSFATNTLNNHNALYFGTIIASGVRVKHIDTNKLTYGVLSGPEPGRLGYPVPIISPDQVLRGRQ